MHIQLKALAQRVENLPLDTSDGEMVAERASIVAELDMLALEASVWTPEDIQTFARAYKAEVPNAELTVQGIGEGLEALNRGRLLANKGASTLDSPDFTAVAWHDHWNAHVYFDRAQAQAALRGGNHVTPIQSMGVPTIHIQCETRRNGITGSTSLPVIRVELHDDGAFTAVTDHWPTEKAKSKCRICQEAEVVPGSDRCASRDCIPY